MPLLVRPSGPAWGKNPVPAGLTIFCSLPGLWRVHRFPRGDFHTTLKEKRLVWPRSQGLAQFWSATGPMSLSQSPISF